jgi:hypothetical protein
MLKQKKDIYADYNEENFVRSFAQFFTVVKKQPIASSGRSLYLMSHHA